MSMQAQQEETRVPENVTMARYRQALPQLGDRVFLTDGGLETTLMFHHGLELPHFAAFDLLRSEEGCRIMRQYVETYAQIAVEKGLGLILETPTWRASRDWGALLGYDDDALYRLNRTSVEQLQEVRDRFETAGTPIVVSGNLGPRGDGYQPDQLLSIGEAMHYHRAQIQAFADSRADMVTALTMTHPEEAIGVSLAAREAGIPIVVAFTVETDGRLPCDRSLGETLERVDAETDGYPAYYGINCAHPTHFAEMLSSAKGAPWLSRLRLIRANASSLSHAELDESTELDDGNPEEFGRQCIALHQELPNLNVLGGCCGTDHRHIEAIADARVRSGARAV